MIGIYKITNKINGKTYIGQSVNIKQRWAEHKANLRNNKHENPYLQNAWNKYGENNFTFKVIEECEQSELDDKEIYWISEYCSYKDFENSKGYNMTIGGGGTRKIHKVSQYDLEGHFIKEWDNGLIASQITGINAGSIYGSCIHRLSYADNYIWLYSDEITDSLLIKRLQRIKCTKVLQYDKEGNFIKEWDSLNQIVNELGYNPVQCVNHTTYSCHGYIFKYKNDPLIITKEYCTKVKNINKNIRNKPFFQVNSKGEIIKRYNSLREAVTDGWNERMVNECCRELRNNYKGYIWIYESKYNLITPEYCKKMLDKPKRKCHSILQYDLNNNFIKEYNYLTDVKKDGFNDTNVYDTCMGRKQQYKGYIWKFGKEKEFKKEK